MRNNVLVRNQNIRERYDEEIKKSAEDVDSIIERIAGEHNVGKFYVRSILKEQGVDLQRKTTYSRKNEKEIKARNEKITKMFEAKKSIEEIAEHFDLTTTRVRQITKGLIAKSVDYSGIVKEVQSKINKGVQYADIVEQYGKDMIKTLKTKAKLNVYQLVLKKQNDTIVKMFKDDKTPKAIADHFGLTRDSVYLILKKNGLASRMSKEEKEERDRTIYKLSRKKGFDIEEVATRYDITPTMVRIIIKTQSQTESQAA